MTLEEDLRADDRFERALFWRELLIIAATVALIAARAVFGDTPW